MTYVCKFLVVYVIFFYYTKGLMYSFTQILLMTKFFLTLKKIRI